MLAPSRIEFEGAAQVARLRRTVTKKSRKTVEVVYLISSSNADPETLAAWVRGAVTPPEITSFLWKSLLGGRPGNVCPASVPDVKPTPAEPTAFARS